MPGPGSSNQVLPWRAPKRATASVVAAALLLAAATVLVSPWRMVDPDGLSHLAVGRLIVETGAVPRTDPFTFAAPGRSWSNPEWLGDVAWYAAWRAGGAHGVVALRLALVALGFLLALRLGRRQGAATLPTLALLLAALPAGLARFTERNHVHALWLIPACGLVLAALGAPGDSAATPGPRAVRRRLAALGLLMVLWANLHGSFPLAWLLLVAALAQAVTDGDLRRPGVRGVVVLLALAPLLGMVSPHLWRNYGQVFDHVAGASVYRAVIIEWQPPLAAPAPLMHLPLHLLAAAGVASFLPRCNRRAAGAAVLLLAGLVLAYTAQRFVPEMAVLVVPPVAANVTRAAAASSATFRRALAAVLLCVALPLVAFAAWGARRAGPVSVLARPESPLAAARYLAGEPPGSRVVAPFDAGPWLLWVGAGRFSLYVDPRNSLGAAHLRGFLREILPDPRRFETEARRLGVTHVLVDRRDPRMAALAAYLASAPAPGWRRVFADARYVLYARAAAAGPTPTNGSVPPT
ncbi:MAG: hypothetical protein HY906_00435 [Deltaproteobacteria bacterium]|nr:hypothetical protein [Deltaproteobacteria bacterium]